MGFFISKRGYPSWQVADADRKKIEANAKASCIGGVSYVRKSRSERMSKQYEDSIVGQIAHYCCSCILFGSPDKYFEDRDKVNASPYSGDGGSDFIGARIDSKGSRLRYRRIAPSGYHLIVRPAEMHDNTVYVHMIVNLEDWIAHSLGWATSNMFPGEVDSSGPLAGAYTIPVPELNPVMPMWWRKEG